MPVAIHGSSRVRNWKRLQFPKVTVLYGDPIRWERVEDPTREQQQEVADAIFAEVRTLYGQLDARRAAAAWCGSGASCAGRDEVLRPGVLAGVRVAGAGGAVAARARALGANLVAGRRDRRARVGRRRRLGGRAALDRAWDAIQPAVEGPLAGGGLIVLLAPPPGDAHAEAARAGLENMARTLSIEWARLGIRPVAISPGRPTRWRSWLSRAFLASPAGRLLLGLPLRSRQLTPACREGREGA